MVALGFWLLMDVVRRTGESCERWRLREENRAGGAREGVVIKELKVIFNKKTTLENVTRWDALENRYF